MPNRQQPSVEALPDSIGQPPPPPPPLPPPPPPPVQQHVHFVFRFEATLRKRGPWVPPQAPAPSMAPLPQLSSITAPSAAGRSSGQRGGTPKSRPMSAVPDKAPAPPAITDVDPNSLLLKLQFKPWVNYDQHQDTHFPSAALEQQKRAMGKGSAPEHDIVLPPAYLSYSPEATAVVEKAKAEALAAEVLAQAAAEAAGLQEPGPLQAGAAGATKKVTPSRKGSAAKGAQTPPPLTPERLVWDGRGEEPPRGWYLEHHFMVNVDEEFVRAMAQDQAELTVPLELAQPPPEPPPKPAKGQPAVPETPAAGARVTLSLGCGGLLVGETAVTGVWPSKLRPLPPELSGLCDSISVSLQALSPPVKPPEEAPATNKGGAKGKPTTAAKATRDAAPEVELSAMPGDPIKLLTPELALRLNPLVVVPLRANAIPDTPATTAQLDEKCEPIRLRMCWPAKLPPREQLGRPGPWAQVSTVSRQGPATHQRSIGFGQAQVLLAGDFTADEVLQWCQERPLTLEVHDRTAIPEPPEFPVKHPTPSAAADQPPAEPKPEPKSSGKQGTRKEQEAAAAAAAAAAAEAEAAAKAAAAAKESDGYVCGIARVPLLELMRGGTMLRFTAPLSPHTTIRGAASLDWSKRPGNYSAVGSVLKGWVRTAVPITAMKGVMPLCERLYSRVAFVMDYRDSELFHLLEDTVRRQNAVALGLVELPPPKPSGPLPPLPPPQAVLQRAMATSMGTKSSHTALEEALLRAECGTKEEDITDPFLQAPGQAALDELAKPSLRPRTSNSRPNSSKQRRTSMAEDGDAGGHVQHLCATGGRRRTSDIFEAGASFRRSANSAPGQGSLHGGASGMQAGDWGAGPATRAGAMTAAKSTKLKGRAQQCKDKDQKDRKGIRFRGFAGVDGGSAASDGSAEDEVALTPAALRLNSMLERLERIPLDMRLLQALSSTKLPPSELPKPAPPMAKPPTPKGKPAKATGKQTRPPSPPPPPTPPPPPQDLLTGFHLVDGARRIIMLEGLCDRAMRIVRAIMDWCLETPQPEPSWLRRVVLHNSMIRYSIRLWAELGADLHILKLGAPLHKIIAEASSYATGKVRVECIMGLRRLGALACLKPGNCWARLVDDLQLYPSPNMVHLVDKKFGGELSKADVFGVEVCEFESDEEDGGVMGLVDDDNGSTASSRRSHARSRRGQSRKSKARSRGTFLGHDRIHPPLQPLDTHNEAYLAMRQEARARRAQIDFQDKHRQLLAEQTAATSHLRAEWASWNPYRQAMRELSQAVEQGVLTLEDTYRSWSLYHTLSSKGKLGPTNKLGMVEQEGNPEEEAARHGWAAHPEPFRWPVPKPPSEYAAHPHAPSDFRRAQLSEPWEEGAMLLPLATSDKGPAPGAKDFVTTVNRKGRTGIHDGLFGQDPEFWLTVHQSGAMQKQRELELQEKEQLEWTKKLIVEDPVMHATFPHRHKGTQEDRIAHILHDEPMKKSLQMAYVPPPPLSMYAEMPWAGEPTTKLPKIDRSTFVAPGKDFKNALAVPKRDVSKLGPGQYQSWTASIHDKVYSQY